MPRPLEEILFEFVAHGAFVRVAAVDAATGAEAMIIAPAGAARCDLERLAAAKLARQMARAEAKTSARVQPPHARRGKVF